MATKIPRIKFFNSVVKNKMPEAEGASIGELFINANAERPFISTKDSNGDMKKVIFEDEINADLEAEATARKNADDELQENLDNETKARQDADNTLTTNLANEVYRAKKSEEALGNRITDENQRATDAETTLTDNLNQEIQDRTDEVERLDTKIETETLRATSAEKVLTDILNKETQDRTDEIARVDGRIDTEIQDRNDADTAIREELSGNTEELKTTLSAETKAREDADNLISKNLDKEIQDRKDVITTLTNKHDEDVSAITKSITDNKVKIVKVADSLLPANVKEAFKLTNGLNVQLGETINIYKDSSLQKVELVDQKLRFSYINVSGGTDVVDIDCSKFLAESEFKDGFQVHADGTVYLKIADDSEAYLTVGENGLKFSGLDSLNDDINSKIEAETQRATEAETAIITNLNGEIDRAKKSEEALGVRIDAETIRAKAAESGLTDSLKAEIVNRTSEVERLDGRIDTEIQDRTDEVARLDGRIGTEIQDRNDADTAIREELSGNTEELKTALSAETKAREDADNLITKNLNAEIANRKSDTSALTKSITDEVVRAKTAEGTIINSINEETTNRTEADNALDAKISAETENRVADKKSLTKSITDEIARATSAETANKNAIDGEVTRAKGIEKSLQDQITKLKTDTSSSDALNAEISARTEADKALEAKIKAVGDTACKVTDVTVNGVSVVAEKVANIDLSSKADVSALTTERKAREDADTKLTSSITKEVSDRKSEITRVEGVIANETSARVSAITSLNSEIADLKANGGKIQDVTVNGVSVVANKVANIDLSNYLDKSTYNTDKQAIDDTLSNKADLVNGRIPLEQLGNLDTNILIIANDLPTSDIKENKIYLVPSQTSGETNIYTEYVYINSAWEILGSYTSSVDTSNFVLKSELEADEQAIAAAFNVIRKEYTDKFANINLSSKADVSALTTEVSERKSADSAITKSITDEIARAKGVEATKADASELSNYVLKSDYDALKADYDALKADVLNRLTAIESVDALDAGNY